MNINYNSVIDSTINVCEFLNGTDGNIVLKWLLDLYRTSLPPGILHPCPYYGDFTAYNLSLNPNFLQSKFLVGTYQANVRFFDDRDNNVMTLIHELEGSVFRGKTERKGKITFCIYVKIKANNQMLLRNHVRLGDMSEVRRFRY